MVPIVYVKRVYLDDNLNLYVYLSFRSSTLALDYGIIRLKYIYHLGTCAILYSSDKNLHTNFVYQKIELRLTRLCRKIAEERVLLRPS